MQQRDPETRGEWAAELYLSLVAFWYRLWRIQITDALALRHARVAASLVTIRGEHE